MATPQELIDESECYLCLPGVSQADAIELALLNQIATALSGGVTAQQVYQDSFADPNGNLTPDDPTKAALYYPDGSGTTFQWDVPSQQWL